MREFEVPATYTIPDDASMANTVFQHAKESPNFVPFKIPVAGGGWTDVTSAQFAEKVTAVAKGLIASGVEAGDRVAIMATTRFEWVLLDYAIWTAGGCTVAIYESSAAEQAKWILEDSGTVLIVVEAPRHFDTVAEVADSLPDLRETLQIDSGAIDELISRGKEVSDETVESRRAKVTASSPATLIYTSGTTGRPKGVQLTHSNLYAESAAVRIALKNLFTEGNKTLMFLPLAHVFARAISVGALDAKVTIAHTSDWSTLVEQFGAFQPDFILSVPRVFEKVFNSAKQKAHDGGKGKIFDAAAATAIAWSEAQDTGGAGIGLKVKHAVFDKLVYSKLKAALGGQCKGAVSGGGPLGARLGHFFRGVGVTIYEGYGLTETSAAVTVNTPDNIKVGSVGQPIGGHGAKVADDGELLVRGPVVFSGYWKNDEATAESFVDGWFRTGDLGAIDENGFIAITGRKKELIVTAAGKNVSPAQLEDSLRAHPLISQTMVVGDGQPFIGALITLDPESLPGWKERNGLPADTSVADLAKNPDLIAEIEAAVAETNKKVSKAEQIKKIRILDVDWTQEGGELTPKMSLKRNIVLKQYAGEVEAIYS
ncbi:long-chain fatty acid--CoA ligase [Antrihabitans sp. YC2-6]|uniref:AMP-dependent synthetase/ligase n=1 Tax=Antrihabitans sp. YC2-6 TaxID=2799498 RepID=UPI0018F5430C|nr:long-chain fatty acid--CoA ligase [Antrihabitans sp. YC2-6]MBJ8348740.1 long-chain fatty acid--CoA ligase [Antrihabitans sp. YC2-6]